jgi:CO/xanthine dehydrogenase Mo-binding subunit
LQETIETPGYLCVGKSVQRIDLLEKISGKGKYVEDIKIEGALYAKILGSQVSHGIIRHIDLGEARRVQGVMDIVTSKDIPGENLVGYIPEMPALATQKVRYYGEPILLVVATDPERASEALAKIRVEIEPLAPLVDPMDSFRRRDVLVHEESGTNIAFEMRLSKGNVEQALRQASVVVENEYTIPSRDHGYIEKESAFAIPAEDGGLTVIVQQQNPHVVQRNVARVLNIAPERIRIIQPLIGGSFGGKNDMGIILGSQAAIAAHKLQRPVLLTYSREESLTRHAKSESAIVRYVSAASEDGDLLSTKVKIIIDSGAYAVRSPAILWRAAVEAPGPYEVPNVEVQGYCVYTNKVYVGGLRGFGSPTAAFAAECQMEALASRLGMDPVEFRLKNILKPGSSTATGQKIDDNIDFEATLVKLTSSARWVERRRRYASGKKNAGSVGGIGVGCAWHGISVGSGYGKKRGRIVDWSAADVKVGENGNVTVFTGIVEMGQGTSTALAQIASEILGLPLSWVSLRTGTTIAPDTGGTHASRGMSMGGLAVAKACRELKAGLTQTAAELLDCCEADVVFEDGQALSRNTGKQVRWNELVSTARRKGILMEVSARVEIPRGEFDPETGLGHAFPTYSFTAVIAEVQVDTLTGDVKVIELRPAVAAGRIINPAIAEDQVLGGLVFGLGGALMEEVLFDPEGRVANNSLSTYMLPTIADVPEMTRPIFIEDVSKYGVFGAKGIGEVIPSAVPPAIASAVYNATGILMTELPLSKERVWRKLKQQ